MKQNTLLHLFCASYSFQSVMLKKGCMVSIASLNGDFHENLLQKIIIFVIVTLVFYFPFNYRYTCDRVIQTKCQYFSLRFSNEIIQFSRYILLLLFYFSQLLFSRLGRIDIFLFDIFLHVTIYAFSTIRLDISRI